MKYLFSGLWVIFFFYACSKDNTISLDFQDAPGVDQLDSFTISSSTILFDSIPTSGQSRILLGTFHDSFSGITTSNSFFQIDLPSISAPTEKNLQFDSLKLVLYYDDYYYGDTSKPQTINIHQLAQKIELKDVPTYLDSDEKPVFVSSSALYNNSLISYNPTPIASITYTPYPKRQDTLSVKLPDTMGQEWFDLILNNDTKMSNSELFLDYFKGLALISPQTNENFIGFRGDTLNLNLFYSYTNTNGFKSSAKISFAINSTLQYNSVISNRTTSELAGLINHKTEVSSTSTNGKSIVQSGSGLITKLTFPGLPSFFESMVYPINKAELRIPVTINADKAATLPTRLILMFANKNNIPQSLLTSMDSSTDTQYGYLQKESDAKDKYYYSFNLTQDIHTIGENQKLGKSLLISYPLDNLFNTAEQAIILNQSTEKIKLIITYTKF